MTQLKHYLIQICSFVVYIGTCITSDRSSLIIHCFLKERYIRHNVMFLSYFCLKHFSLDCAYNLYACAYRDTCLYLGVCLCLFTMFLSRHLISHLIVILTFLQARVVVCISLQSSHKLCTICVSALIQTSH